MICIVSEEIKDQGVKYLQNFVDDIIFIKKYSKLYEAINSHADIQCFVLDSKHLIVHPQIEKNIIRQLTRHNINVITGKNQLEETYPQNVFYNAVRLGNRVIHNTNFTDDIILEHVHNYGLEFINVRQGYAKCSILNINERSIITSDKGIAKKIAEYDVDVLLIQPGHIILPGLNYGFIGGAAGALYEENLIIFNGDIKTHPNYREICNFIKSKGMNYFCINSGPLVDVGSIFFL